MENGFGALAGVAYSGPTAMLRSRSPLLKKKALELKLAGEDRALGSGALKKQYFNYADALASANGQ